ncbi:uncharacterized protein [Chanodichthys erythropterus]|uniref:uncharacterized protein n=1 Tax=Chanodichthys erythropterus TaxID=933992 RepID=UPI00351F15A0
MEMLVEIREDIRTLKKSVGGAEMHTVSKIPAQSSTVEELNILDKSLNCLDEKLRLIDSLSSVGGMHLKDNVKRVMEKLMTNDVMARFNMKGGKGKLAFTKLNLYTVVTDCTPDCPSLSMNFGIIKTSVSCCNTDLCNVKDAPDPSTTVPNGKTCYSCDDKSCSKVLNCTGSEDRCIAATGSYGGQSAVVKGCVSKLICDATALVPNVPNVEDIACCEGNLCNGAQSVTQSFLFLCCSLLSYFLLH